MIVNSYYYTLIGTTRTIHLVHYSSQWEELNVVDDYLEYISG